MKKILVTGGAGFIGVNLVEYLAKILGYDVYVVDNLSSNNKLAFQYISKLGIKIFVQDIQDFDAFEIGFDAVVHLAALNSVPRSLKLPEETYKNNAFKSLELLNKLAKHNIKNVVIASSSSIYGEFPNDNDFLEELAVNCPRSVYGVSKKNMENIAFVFASLLEMNIKVLRFFNVFGPYQNKDSQYSAVIPKFINAALKNEPLVIYGDGGQSRDFTYIDNVIAGIVKAIDYTPHHNCDVFNIACNNSISVLDLANVILDLTKSKSELSFAPARKGDVYYSKASILKARKSLGYIPQVSFEDGIELTLKFYENNS